MRVAAIAAVSVLSLALPSQGQDAAGKKLLEGLSGFDAKLAKTYQLGFYMNGKVMGQATVTVGKAAAESGATYKLELAMKLSLGPQQLEGTEVQLLDEKLALISRTESETTRQDGKSRTKSTSITKADGSWSYEVRRGQHHAGCKGADEGLDHWESGLLLARKVPLSPGIYKLRGNKWPDWSALMGKGAKPTYQEMTITVPEAKAFAHRGKTVQAHVIVITRPGEDPLGVAVDAAGELLAMWPIGGPPIRFIAGTVEECKRDLPGAKSDGKQPVDAVMVYFKVVFKTLPVAKLDDVMDWTAVRAEAGKADVELSAFADELKAQFEKQAAPPGKEALQYLPSLLKTVLKGDTARVFLENRKADEFRLKRAADGTWRITHFPH